MFYGKLTTNEIDNLDKQQLVVLFPIGTVEQHGAHLPSDTDSRIAQGIAKKVEEKNPQGIVVLPTFNYGVVGTMPGNLELTKNSFEAAILDICKSVLGQGFNKIFLLNGHSGNQNYLTDIVGELNSGDAPCAMTIPLYLSGERGFRALKQVGFNDWIRHGDEVETSLVLALDNNLVKKDKIKDETGLIKTKDFKPLDDGIIKLGLSWGCETKIGICGEPSKATKEIGEFLLNEAAEEILDMIKQFEDIIEKVKIQKRS